jgi:hypothetical protein
MNYCAARGASYCQQILMARSVILLVGALAAVSIYSQTPSASPAPKHKTKVETKYDAHKNETELRIGPLDLWKPPQTQGSGELNFEKVELLVSFSFPGKKIVTPTSVTLLVFSFSQWGPQLEKRPNVSITNDSGLHNYGDLEILSVDRSRVTTGVGSTHTQDMLTTEVVKKSIPFDEFTQLAESKKAEIKLGDRKFKFTADHLEAFRNFVMLMKQQGLEF